MFHKLQSFVLLGFLALSQPVGAADILVDGVPLPSDATVAAAMPGSAFQQWSGVWVGVRSNNLKTILLVESVSDGAAKVVYAIGDNHITGIQRRWLRLEGIASGRTLKVTGQGFLATYEMTDGGGLKARFEGADRVTRATMTKADFASLTKPDAVVAWTRGKSEFLQTDLIEDGKPVRLEAVVFRPPGAGPFPLAVINHGSTGRGRDPGRFTETSFEIDLADFLNDRGWIVAFPQRRGRGKSDGCYDEGLAENRARYTGDIGVALRGADRALSDIDAAISALRQRQDVASGPVLVGGISRGGVLAVAYAGLHPEQVVGVINFVGGWLGEGSPTAIIVNRSLFERGASYRRSTIWLYGQYDSFYSIAHSRENFAAFEKAGGQGKFFDFDMPLGQGHTLVGHPNLWSGPLHSYLSSLAAAEN
ncbi:alpha/beta hydrolase [Bradyrhizobium sediminis]|uniref:Alpha/beta hydrolase n=1 Tax=Bradyrhizobium sediminis TaxID=2840469 RepID=A0A975NCM4_9BRAD|nr:alpha/beta hydrolase [Bradyrhizobium sediminis]QWG12663.1 alpha/beta hydrolase [Bradyrhizobium sediminis]